MKTQSKEIEEALKHALLTGDDEVLDDIAKGNHIIRLSNPQGDKPPIIYDAKANPIIEAFHNDRESQVKALWSPFGSGTTTALVWEMLVGYPILSVLPNIEASPDGIYRISLKSGVMRSTLQELKRGFLRSLQMIVPPSMDVFYHTARSSIVHKKEYQHQGKRVLVEGEIDFIGLDKSGSEGKIPSLILDIVAVNEPRVVKYNLVQALGDRAGRYCYQTNPKLIIYEGNPPGRLHNIYDEFGGLPPESVLGIAEPRSFGAKDTSEHGHMQEVTEDITKSDGTPGKRRSRVWWYPSGDSPYAANRHNLPDGYYDAMKNRPLSDRCSNLYGLPSSYVDGEPVFDAFNEITHMTRENIPLAETSHVHHVAYDTDTKAGAILLRKRDDGGWLIVGCTDGGRKKRAPEKFAIEIVQMLRKAGINNLRHVSFFCDPAGRNNAPHTTVPFFRQIEQVVNAEFNSGVTHEPLPWEMQDPKARWSAGNYVLNRGAPGSGKPFVKISHKAENMLYAFGSYAFKDSEALKFNKKGEENAVAATFGDCFMYWAQIISLREDWKGENANRDEYMDEELERLNKMSDNDDDFNSREDLF